jgi:Ricin-type beta-trefoil lectin domain
MLSKTGEIRRDEACLDYAGQEVILYPCHGSKGNQYWEYNRAVRKCQTLLQNFSINKNLHFSQNWCATAAAKSALE